MKPDPQITDILSQKRHILSIEFFPPKETSGVPQLKEIAATIGQTHPDFVSVTYGAGGSTRERSLEICKMLKADQGFTVMPHLTCVGATRTELEEIIHSFYDEGFRNIMALRGDPPKGQSSFQVHAGGLQHASELVTLIKSLHPDICCGVAGYPDKHPEAPDLKTDLLHVKEKILNGGSFITTQLFYRNATYFAFVEKARELGITAPILPGIMPVLSLKQAQRFCSDLPSELAQRLEAAGENPEAVEDVGIAWAMEQIHELIQRGAPGVHLYVLNRARSALALSQAISQNLS